ncbi:MAG: sulfur carrier protein ThiS, partial [Candidatus Omnitrophica bacterium]|nr:sulfur carrier protein ThiS [Candidatus Omnitrophota bacterium]
MAIAIYVNGKKEEIKDSLTIQGLLDVKKIRPEVVTVELNEEIIAKDKYGTTVLKPGDKLEFVYYMGGGMPFSDRVANNVMELIGQTPMVRLNRIVGQDSAQILAKLEMFNPGGSVKDRICLSMIE